MTTERSVVVGSAATGLDTHEMVLNIGPQHPSTHGVLRLRLTLDGELIITAEPVIGYMHRGAEKLFEVRDYRQIIVLANRHDWLSAFSNELGVALAVERLIGIEVPVRATWLRTLRFELVAPDQRVEFDAMITLRPRGGLPMRVIARERHALGRAPSEPERRVAEDALQDPAGSPRPSAPGLADLLWSIFMKSARSIPSSTRRPTRATPGACSTRRSTRVAGFSSYRSSISRSSR